MVVVVVVVMVVDGGVDVQLGASARMPAARISPGAGGGVPCKVDPHGPPRLARPLRGPPASPMGPIVGQATYSHPGDGVDSGPSGQLLERGLATSAGTCGPDHRPGVINVTTTDDAAAQCTGGPRGWRDERAAGENPAQQCRADAAQ